MDMSINIRMVENGILLRYTDPEKAKEAEESDTYVDTDVELVFPGVEDAMPKIQEVLQTFAGVEPTDKESFDEAFKEADNER